MAEPTSKAELLRQIDESWSGYWDAVELVGEARMVVLGPDGWSVKDQVAHVTAWERSLIALLTGQSRAAAVGMDEAEYAGADVDQVNARIQSQTRSRSTAEVLAEARTTHAELLAVLEPLSWEDLGKPYSHFQPTSPERDEPVLGSVLGNTIEHYPEHREYLEAAVAVTD